MKTLLILFLILSYQLSANELKWVDEQIDAIKPPREGISKSKIDTIKNPFLFLTKKKIEDDISSKDTNLNNFTQTDSNTVTKKEIQLSLEAIINKSALINGKWYKPYDKIGKYLITSIDRGIVILTFKKKNLLLSTKTNSKNLKFKK